MTLSPAESYALHKSKGRYPKTQKFSESFPFELDPFQIDACHALENGKGVLVAAPTGAGKTIIGEFAVDLVINSGGKCFYTTPIKALSNQKFTELCAKYGESKIGLLTGDISINSEAQIVIMTTEVLRNMIYSNSKTIDDLKYVVMDEVHYLADKFRGAVWEEILIHLSDAVQIISLSATVSNAEEFGEWLQTVRGETEVIVSEIRPVPLYQHVLFGNRLIDLFGENQKLNPELTRLERDSYRQVRGNWRDKPKGPKPLMRSEVIEKLDREGLLPAITFIFSRNNCDAAVRQCLAAGIKLTNTDERKIIRSVIAKNMKNLAEEDLVVLGYYEWADALERGIAAHHAGLLPAFKVTVEELFQQGLVKAVFATETLALGINMPARTVVLEKLSKWNGEGHVAISPGEYTQLTGRAGRRGIDIEGNAVILWNNDLDSTSVGGLASTRTYPLKSSFKPTYNMSINLISQFGSTRARTSLESSLAQFQADKAVVGLAKQIRKNEIARDDLFNQSKCDQGDFVEYSSMRAAIKKLETDSKRSKRKRHEIEEEIGSIRKRMKNHSCHGCPDRENHSRIAERAQRLQREIDGLEERINSRTNVIAKRFDRIKIILDKFGYINNDAIAQSGKMLAKIYGETDLLIAESIQAGVFNQLSPADLVAVISSCIYESRNEEAAKVPRGEVQNALAVISKIYGKIHEAESDLNLEPMRSPDFGFCWASHKWASGHSLTSILKGSDLTVGDFVRSMKQIIDLLRQLRSAAPDLQVVIDQALGKIDRGVIAYAGAAV
ncbi:ATP-dependent RNA helicase HelY [Candidatus Nanopelagicus limnes]|uniref:ATP-dependent RNA helicase HelY n=1 Tax=Candidatus Nanopelagicus limnae TaxID=1884634 RepID=A0A249JXX4_9ACTN|nr:DEAD/DEAH box helicase [Candidatus Nanopelagicus limnes]ASY09377.1 ATP-dependent RNA helicase HelY [Candidatus Nanopelagicus limnes]